MGCNYNTRPLPAEIMVGGNRVAVVRTRQPVEAIWDRETIFNP
jgi:hypothetical protein